jgi:hypothetical protein
MSLTWVLVTAIGSTLSLPFKHAVEKQDMVGQRDICSFRYNDLLFLFSVSCLPTLFTLASHTVWHLRHKFYQLARDMAWSLELASSLPS